jgi:P-type Cu2+ transporter
VAQTISAAGLDQFYRRRETLAGFPALPAGEDEAARNAHAAAAAGLVIDLEDGGCETSLLLDGIRCAACTWLVEGYLQRQPGVSHVSVNFATRRAHLRWNARATTLATLLRAIATIGYRAYPYDPARREALARHERRSLLLRAGIALLAMMQVMMFAIPGYLSGDGVEPEYARLLSWASLFLTLPVIVYCAMPFFRGAWRDLRVGRVSMDAPVALGVGGAFIASAWATMSAGGAVYYDSVTMFVALLLVARYFELRARQKSADAIEAIAHDLPQTAERLSGYPAVLSREIIAASALRHGDYVCIAAGAPIPADGEIVDGRSSVEEALLTGESWPRTKAPGDAVFAGSINRESPLVVRVHAAGQTTTLAALVRLVERAASERPRVARLADRAATWFVAGQLLLAVVSGLVWWSIDPARALSVTFAVLVVSCPCALSLATPAALTAAAAALGRRQILAVRADALETLSRVSHAVLDKTGTLTTGRVQLTGVDTLGAHDARACLALASALEQGSSHPIATALRAQAEAEWVAHDIVAVAGCGVEGTIAGQRYRCGRPAWVGEMHKAPLPTAAPEIAASETPVALADAYGWIAWLTFGDTVRPEARALVASLQHMGLAVSLISGDRAATVQYVADAVGIADAHGNTNPEDKRTFVTQLQQQGAVVAMVGDGINDAPSLAQANVSFSFGNAATLTQWTADVVALGDDLGRIAEAIASARRAFRVIRQNLAWALVYNLVAMPLAATGHLAPLAAALGMSLSSLLVVANSLRLLRASPVGAASTTLPSATASMAPTR